MRPRRAIRASVVAALAVVLAGCAPADSPRRVDVDVPEDCRTVHGPQPWIFINGGQEPEVCVRVGVHQNLQIWNKGVDPTTVSWFGARLLSSDTSYETGRLGADLSPGTYEVWSSEGITLVIVANPDESPYPSWVRTEEALGPVTLGMTLSEADSAGGTSFRIDTDIEARPGCLWVHDPDDPYSPTLEVRGSGSPDDIVVGIQPAYPTGPPIGAFGCQAP